MVAMAKAVVAAVSLPVTVKTRIGWGPESDMPIVDLARRLEDVGVAGLTIHCRTAQMGHAGAADWRFAARAKAAVGIPVIANGDVVTADDVVRALAETGCDGVMIGRGAINYPWVFREARARLERGVTIAPPTDRERLALLRTLLVENAAARGERPGVHVTRRHLPLLSPPLALAIGRAIMAAPDLAATLAVLDDAARGTEVAPSALAS
jgi:tRNA-dihydrouridine synthase